MSTRGLCAIIEGMKVLCALSIALALGACAVTESQNKALGGYVGAPEQALIAAMGHPSSVEDVDGTRYVSYRSHRASYIPAVTPFYQPICPPSVCVPLGGTRGFMLTEQCTTTFAIEDGKVKGWRREGTACGA